MAWMFGNLSVKEMTDSMIRGAMNELQCELAERQQPCHGDGHSIFNGRNDGASTSFYSCKCGASVQPQDREAHAHFHRHRGHLLD